MMALTDVCSFFALAWTCFHNLSGMRTERAGVCIMRLPLSEE